MVPFKRMVDSGVLRIVSSNNVEIFRHLGAAQLKRAGIEHSFGSTTDEIRKLITETRPTLVLLDAVLADGSGYDLCREIKNNPALSSTHIIMLHSGIMSSEQLKTGANSGCDDVLAMPLHTDDFYCHLAQVTGVSLRDAFRVGVEMQVRLQVQGQSIPGEVINLSANGLGVQVAGALELGPITLWVQHDGTAYDDIMAEIVWCSPNQRGYAVGLRLLHVPALARGLLARLSLFQVSENLNGDGVTVAMQGVFDEHTDFRPLLSKLQGIPYIDFMMQCVEYLSSSGVSAWCMFLQELAPETAYSFRNCSVAFASQAAMVPMAVSRGVVISVQAPYVCETCDREETRLIESSLVRRSDGPVAPPTLHCHVCSNVLTFDDLPERYFAFLMH